MNWCLRLHYFHSSEIIILSRYSFRDKDKSTAEDKKLWSTYIWWLLTIFSLHNCSANICKQLILKLQHKLIQFSTPFFEIVDPFCADKEANQYYPINFGQPNAHCSNRYIHCNEQKQQSERTCGTSSNGIFFDPDTRQCKEGNPSADNCPSKLII